MRHRIIQRGLKVSRRIIKHKAAREAIIRLIREEGYKVGDALPSVARLAPILKTGKMPVQQAVKLLETEGFLENIPGSGCYVKAIPSSPMAEDKSFNEELISVTSMSASAGTLGQKNIKIAILSEMLIFGDGWRRLFLEYMKKSRGIRIDLVHAEDTNEAMSLLEGRKVDIAQIKNSSLAECADKRLLFDPGKAGGIDETSWGEFYRNQRASATWNGITWGIPMIIGINCMYYRKKYAKHIMELNKVSGFWKWLENARSFMKNGKSKISPPLFINNFHFLEMLSLAGVKSAFADDYAISLQSLNKKDIIEFVERFEPFLHDRSIWGISEEAYRIPALETFMQKDIPLVIGSSSWLPVISKYMKDEWEMSSMFQEDKGACSLSSNINVVSSGTPYPEECVEILNWLAKAETQRFWSSRGRLVANKSANSLLNLDEIDAESRKKLDVSIEKGKMRYSSSPHTDECILNVINPEFMKWQEGHCNAREFIGNLNRKVRHFLNARNSFPVK